MASLSLRVLEFKKCSAMRKMARQGLTPPAPTHRPVRVFPGRWELPDEAALLVILSGVREPAKNKLGDLDSRLPDVQPIFNKTGTPSRGSAQSRGGWMPCVAMSPHVQSLADRLWLAQTISLWARGRTGLGDIRVTPPRLPPPHGSRTLGEGHSKGMIRHQAGRVSSRMGGRDMADKQKPEMVFLRRAPIAPGEDHFRLWL